MSTGEGLTALAASLRTLTVNLIGYESNAQFVNPLNLLWNQVVDETWVCEKGAQIGLNQSSFTYTNGVQVEAFEDSVTFKQSGTPLVPGPALAAEIATRYVDAFGANNWMAISFEFLARINLSKIADFVAPDIWPELSDRLTINEIQPRFGTNVFYFYPEKRVRVELNFDPSSDPDNLTCLGWVYRELSSISGEADAELQAAFGAWESDWDEVTTTAANLLTASIISGGSK